MRAVNLTVLAEGFACVPTQLQAGYEAQLSERDDRLSSVKPHEAACVKQLVADLRDAGAGAPHLYEGFAYSFRIPQISSEFDLLKITDDAVLNVELKVEDVGEERMQRQLRRNRHYLRPLGRRAYTFTFVLGSRALYELDDAEILTGVGVDRLAEVLSSLGSPYDGQYEELFRASDYLVSPLNDTKEFLDGEYFLTNHQEQIKTSFLNACAAAARGVKEPPAFVVYGSAGTGKSLLLYDVARSLRTELPVCVVHCGVLVPGHEVLNQAQNAFCIVPAKGSESKTFEGYGAILVDEAQRMWPGQLRSVTSAACKRGIPLFLSLDRQQVLGANEGGRDVEQIVGEMFPHVRTWRLSRRIRTNRGLTDFIRTLFELRGHREVARTRHVKIAYATDAAAARKLVDVYRSNGFEHIMLGVALPGELVVEGCPTTNAVVGQEFDRVVMAVGPEFLLDGAGSHESAIYREHVFQGVTRARDDLVLVVYDNPVLLARLLSILGE